MVKTNRNLSEQGEYTRKEQSSGGVAYGKKEEFLPSGGKWKIL